jgi:hypothetical protein
LKLTRHWSVLREIRKREDFADYEKNKNDTLCKLTKYVLKKFDFYPDKELNKNIRNIGSGFLRIVQAIESIRSNNTNAHAGDLIIKEPRDAMLIVNSVATVGLFLLKYYEEEYRKKDSSQNVSALRPTSN